MKTIQDIEALLKEKIREGTLIQGIISGLKKGDSYNYRKTAFRPIILKSEKLIQLEYHEEKKVIHSNQQPSEAADTLVALLEKHYSQLVIYAADGDYQVLSNKKGYAILKKPATKKPDPTRIQHDKVKQYILSEGTAYPFLVELGVMDGQGKVFKPKYDKFRQLNRYLEFIRDCVDQLPKERPIRIVDFGCGKAYLTFALYHYLVKELGYQVEIVGLDLKEEVMVFCRQTALKLGFDRLKFEIGDISTYESSETVDMVVSLHACDIATDASLAKAVGWGARVILAVPCCQHEFNPLLNQEALSPLLKHGLLRERFASLATDTVRGMVLEVCGYEVQMVEFIDMEHTPKNILIRAIRRAHPDTADSKSYERYQEFKKTLGLGKTYIDKAFETIIK